jgi:hypothetical protein
MVHGRIRLRFDEARGVWQARVQSREQRNVIQSKAMMDSNRRALVCYEGRDIWALSLSAC